MPSHEYFRFVAQNAVLLERTKEQQPQCFHGGVLRGILPFLIQDILPGS